MAEDRARVAQFSMSLDTGTDSACGDAHTQDHALVLHIGGSGIHLASGFALGLSRIAPRCLTAQGTATMTFQAGTGSGSWAWNQDWYMRTSLA